MQSKKVFYSKGGMSLILNDITDLFKDQIDNNISKVVINTSSQPNSNPHLGTLTTLSCAFALAKRIKQQFNISVEVEFDELENSPYQLKKVGAENYSKSLGDTFVGNVSVSDIYMEKYIFIFEYLKKITDVNYTVKTYSEFQSNNIIRRSVIDVYKNYVFFGKLLDPANNTLMLRTKCPLCNCSNRDADLFKFDIVDDSIYLTSKCLEHGEYSVTISENNDTYIDINTQLRDLTKGVLFYERLKKDNVLTIMCDGKDWSGEWASRIHYSGMHALGYDTFTNRVFTPLIVDWYGGKYSKSLYLENDKYSGIEKLFADFNLYYNRFGDDGIYKIYSEVEKWVADPVKFFRNYSIEYFVQLLEVQNEQKRKIRCYRRY